jgi:hypothetical protein
VVLELPEGVRVREVRSAFRDGFMDFHQNANELRIGWFAVEGASLNQNDLLFTLELEGVASLDAGDLRFGELSEAASPLAEIYPLVGLRFPRVLQANQELTLFPNPARDLSQIRVNLNAEAQVSYRVMDAVGRVVSSDFRSLSAGINLLDLRTDTWSEGQYQVEVTLTQGQESRKESFRLQVRK